MKGHKPTKNQLSAPASEASNRPSRRSGFERENSAGLHGNSTAKGGDSIPFQGIPSHAAGPGPTRSKTMRLTRQQLIQIEAHLSARDHAVLQAIRKYRFLTSTQIGNLYITACSTCA